MHMSFWYLTSRWSHRQTTELLGSNHLPIGDFKIPWLWHTGTVGCHIFPCSSIHLVMTSLFYLVTNPWGGSRILWRGVRKFPERYFWAKVNVQIGIFHTNEWAKGGFDWTPPGAATEPRLNSSLLVLTSTGTGNLPVPENMCPKVSNINFPVFLLVLY